MSIKNACYNTIPLYILNFINKYYVYMSAYTEKDL